MGPGGRANGRSAAGARGPAAAPQARPFPAPVRCHGAAGQRDVSVVNGVGRGARVAGRVLLGWLPGAAGRRWSGGSDRCAGCRGGSGGDGGGRTAARPSARGWGPTASLMQVCGRALTPAIGCSACDGRWWVPARVAWPACCWSCRWWSWWWWCRCLVVQGRAWQSLLRVLLAEYRLPFAVQLERRLIAGADPCCPRP
jgi:hypothetical protein